MTYKLEPSLSRITSPIKLIFPDGGKLEYENGIEACRAVFDHRYVVQEMKAVESTVEITLKEAAEPTESFF